ncbi:MAG: 30S ribosomal protein S20 [Candidatus Schekmanbacteria bacterium]|nr:30S ribosomal protein S20 [Candidatus Schekmanbacteria bacterium]
MPKDKSTAKRIRQSEKNRLRNQTVKSHLRTEVKKVIAAVEGKDQEKAKKALSTAIPVIDKAISKGIIHRNTGSRKISRLSKKVAQLSAAK